MKSHFDLTDIEFELAFRECTLDPALFNHEAHLRLAWIHLKSYGVTRAIENTCNQLIAFTASVGASEKYNKTLTIAAVKTVNHFMGRCSSVSFPEFIVEFPILKNDFKRLIFAHYSTDIFKSELAKREWIEPELRPY